MQERKEEQTLGELFAALARDTTTLVRQEIDLARTELTQKISGLGKDVGQLGIGAAVAYAGFLALIAAAVLALGELIPLWVSALIVGIVVLGAGYVLIQRARDGLKRADLTPRETIETLKEDREWVKEQTR